jgi:hypothetical protein
MQLRRRVGGRLTTVAATTDGASPDFNDFATTSSAASVVA